MRKVRCRSQSERSAQSNDQRRERGGAEGRRAGATGDRRCAGWAEEAAIANATDTFLSRLRIAAVLVHQPAEGRHHPWRLCVTLLPGVPCVLLFPAPLLGAHYGGLRHMAGSSLHTPLQRWHSHQSPVMLTPSSEHRCYRSECTTLAVKDRSHAGRRAERCGDPVSAGCADRSATSESQSDHIWRTATRLTNYFFASLIIEEPQFLARIWLMEIRYANHVRAGELPLEIHGILRRVAARQQHLVGIEREALDDIQLVAVEDRRRQDTGREGNGVHDQHALLQPIEWPPRLPFMFTG